MTLLEIDEIQAQAILDMQLRRLAALERQAIIDEADELMAKIADYEDILASPAGSGRSSVTSWPRSSSGSATSAGHEIIPYEGDVTART